MYMYTTLVLKASESAFCKVSIEHGFTWVWDWLKVILYMYMYVD
jgi:hypothetical protein